MESSDSGEKVTKVYKVADHLVAGWCLLIYLSKIAVQDKNVPV